MRNWTRVSAFLGLFAVLAAGGAAGVEFEWDLLPPLPEPISGQAVGVHNGALVVAGGSNFEVSPWQGGTKDWKDRIYVLPDGAGAWVDAGALPGARAYAGAVSHPTGVYIFGGSNGDICYDNGLRLTWEGGKLGVEELDVRLPQPCAFTSAALVNDTAYMVGGQATNGATQALDTFWALDLSTENLAWRELESCPGPARILGAIAAQSGAVYVFSGAELSARPDGSTDRTYLTDGYAYMPGKGWEQVADVPAPVVAAPAVGYGTAHIIVASGDDGSNFERTAELGDGHPGFPATVRAYHTITGTWVEAGEAPHAFVTTQAVVWQDRVVIPGGEDRPGHRGDAVMSGAPAARKTGLGAIDYTTLTLYLLALVGMGFYFSRREVDTEAFFLGGRRVPWWAVGISIFGTSLSAITYLSIPARAYATDWVFIFTNAAPIILAPVVVGYYVPRFRQSPISTAYEFLEQRFNLPTRIYGSLCFIIFQIGRVGIVMLLPAIALSAATGISVPVCLIAMGVLATLYTALGGIEAVIWTDVLQAIVLVFGALLALVLIVFSIDGGVAELFHTANAADKFHMANWTWSHTTTALWVVVVGNVFSNTYPMTADQTVVQRYLTTRDDRSAGRAVWTNALLTIPITLLFFGLGTALWVFFKQRPELLDPNLKNDAILPLFVVAKFPIGLRGILIAGIFAAAMSSLDSSINSVASVLVNDYYRRWRRGISEQHALRVSRMLTLLFGLVGTGIALWAAQLEDVSLWDPFLKLLNYVGGGLGGIFALGVFTRRANGVGALAGAAAAVLAVIAVQRTETHFFLHGMVGFLTAFLVGYLVSLALPGKAVETGEA